MFDPRNLPDANGLSPDSLRGSESFIDAAHVGSDEPHLQFRERTIGRDPLSLHEATALRAIGRDVPDDALAPDVRDYLATEPETLPEANANLSSPTPFGQTVRAPDAPANLQPEGIDGQRLTDQDLSDFREWQRTRNQSSAPSSYSPPPTPPPFGSPPSGSSQ